MTIVDVHAHYFGDLSGVGEPFLTDSKRAHGGEDVDLSTDRDTYLASSPPGTTSLVLGGQAHLSGLWIPDEVIAHQVKQDPAHMVGFLSLDPTRPGWRDQLRRSHEDLALQGVKLMPMYAGFDPSSAEFDDLFGYAESRGLPVLMHTGTTFVSRAPLRYAHPQLADEVAIRHPELRLILAHMGHPFEGEAIAVIRKHPHVYADVSALHYRPFQLWHALRLAQDYGVMEKLLFGSDYPFTTVDASVEGLRRIAAVEGIRGLDPLDQDAVEAIIQRDALPLLGLTHG